MNGAPRVPGHLVQARLTIVWDVHGKQGPALFRPGSAGIGYRTQSVVRVIRCWISRPQGSGGRMTMAPGVREAPAEQVVELPEPWCSAAVTVVLPTYNEAANLPVIVAGLLDRKSVV